MKSSLDMIEKAQEAARQAINLANESLANIAKTDPSTARDVSNLMNSFLSGNNDLSEDVANQIIKNSEQRLKDMDNANNT